MITKLDAINICLRGIGLAPVDTEDDFDLDSGTAKNIIDQTSTEIQSRGWWFNKEEGWKITPDVVNGYISLSDSVLSIVSSGVSNALKLAIRESKIYDIQNHTFDLRDIAYSDPNTGISYIELTYITEVAFNDLPFTARQAIAFKARRLYAQDLQVDEKRWKFQRADENISLMNLLKEDSRDTKRNSITDNPMIQNFVWKAGGYNSTYY